jgi:protein-tyrosine phosphatase
VSILRFIRSKLHDVRDWLDGRFHHRRRTAALARIADIAPRSILFVCLGNICRSPYAKYRAEARLNGSAPSMRFDSAGFIGPDRQPPEHALAAAGRRGIDHLSHRSKTLSASLVNQADLVIVFDRGHLKRLRRTPGVRMDHVVRLGDLDPEWTGKRAIADPWGKPEEEFDRTFERIDRCIDALLTSAAG